MKLFGKKDELFELMSNGRGRRGQPGSGAQPARGAGPSPGGEGAADGAAEPPSGPPAGPRGRSRPASVTPGPAAKPASRGVAGRSTELAPGASTGPFSRSPRGVARPEPSASELFEVEGDALVVVDDGWDPPVVESGATLLLRKDTAIVGGLVAGALLVGAFLVGRTTTSEPATAAAPPQLVVTTVPASVGVEQGTTALPASAPRIQATAVAAGAPVQPAEPAPPAAAQAPAQEAPRAAAQGKYVIRVCTTTPEKAVEVVKWLNEAPRSPIFGRGELEASAKGGSVRIQGFVRREPDVLSRVRATADPTGGSGTFHDAFWDSAR